MILSVLGFRALIQFPPPPPFSIQKAPLSSGAFIFDLSETGLEKSLRRCSVDNSSANLLGSWKFWRRN